MSLVLYSPFTSLIQMSIDDVMQMAKELQEIERKAKNKQ